MHKNNVWSPGTRTFNLCTKEFIRILQLPNGAKFIYGLSMKLRLETSIF